MRATGCRLAPALDEVTLFMSASSVRPTHTSVVGGRLHRSLSRLEPVPAL